jgi:hypothetical protein
MDNNIDLESMARHGQNMLDFIRQLENNNVGFTNNSRPTFLALLEKLNYQQVNQQTKKAFDINDIYDDGPREYEGEELRRHVNNVDDGLVASLIYDAIEQLTEYVSVINRGEFDGDDPSSAHTDRLHLALNNIMALFNVVTVAAGGRKRQSKKTKTSKKSKKTKTTKKSKKSKKTKTYRKH